MELEFDKEINALLRQTAKQDLLFAENELQTAHLDADEISAFAENAVPEKAKNKYTEHLADCDPCRKSLSDLILLNAEIEIALVKSAVAAPVSIEIPWYRKLFVFPGLAYAMGGLVIAFTGLTAFVVLQNFNSGSFEMAKSNTSSQAPKSVAQELAAQPENSNANASAANSAPESNIGSDENPVAISTPEFDDESVAKQRNQNGPSSDRESPMESRDDGRAKNETVLGAAKPSTQPGVLSESKPADKTVGDDRITDSVSDAAPPPAPKVAERRNEPLSKKDSVLTTRGGVETDAKEETKLKSASKSRQTGGKTFNQRDGVWYDSSYTNQATKNVRRGTTEYKNLDSVLRTIAEKFTETVVVVWKQNAYRIQ